ncbi:MAG: hypothetical protein E4H27_06585 [Anaerolineales bacterium]|nr:MAG: hypothetical protein E4H27_06585 [Anaerolineales bacterium]
MDDQRIEMHDFPPPGYVAIESAVQGIEVYKHIEKTETPGPDVIDFKCPQCLATTAYSVPDGGLRCTHCGYYEAPSQVVVGKAAKEFEFTLETMTVAGLAQGWGASRKELQCQSCQAKTTLPQGHLTHTCPFCGSTQVLQQDAAQDMLRPRFLVPFKVDTDACQKIAFEWLGSSWMTPKSLKSLASVAGFTGIYLPYWTFDAVSLAHWRAEVGHQVSDSYYDSSSKSWKTRTRTVWRWESGQVRQIFDDVLIPGTNSLSLVLLENVQDFDTSQFVPYEAVYLAGFLAQAYDIQLDHAWTMVRDRMREEARLKCRDQATTTQIRQFTMSLDFNDESWRYVLLPVYVAVYRYENRVFQVMVNGQTGTIAGQRPVDWPKVWLAVTGMLAPGVLLGLFGLLASAVGPLVPPSLIAGGAVLVIAFIVLIVGIIFAVLTIMKAGRMDDV